MLWKISEAVRTGALELDLSEASMDELPEELLELSWLNVLDLSRNFFVACECMLHTRIAFMRTTMCLASSARHRRPSCLFVATAHLTFVLAR